MKSLRAAMLGLVATASLALTACSGTDTADTKGESEGAKDANAGAAITVTDVKGREVTFDKQPERIILGEGRSLFATSILNKENPIEHVVAMGADLGKAAPSFKKKLTEVVPEVNDVPEIGHLAKGDVTVENLISFQPDALVMSADHYDAVSTTGMLDKLDEAGIKYVVTDFRQHPMENTTKSISTLGQLFGHEEEAKKFNDDWQSTVDAIVEKTKNLDEKDRPSTLLWRAAGLKDCCATVGRANLGEFVDAAGGNNLGDTLLDTEFGDLTAEKVIEQNPDAIIATGGSWDPSSYADKDTRKQAIPHAELGYFTDKAKAEDTLAGLLQTNGFDQLDAPKNGKFYAVWHQFYDSPMNFLVVEQMAKWLHPDLFKDLDVNAHWEQAHKDYLPFDASGIFFSEYQAN